MILKYLLDVTVGAGDEFYVGSGDDPDAAEVSLDGRYLRRIQDQAAIVKKLKAYHLSFFDYSPNFMKIKDDDELSLDSKLEDCNANIDCVLLNISEGYFGWHGYIKNSNISVETDDLSLEEVRENQKILKVSPNELPILLKKGAVKYESSRTIVIERLKGKLPASLTVCANQRISLEK
jgi:hypothetical protein